MSNRGWSRWVQVARAVSIAGAAVGAMTVVVGLAIVVVWLIRLAETPAPTDTVYADTAGEASCSVRAELRGSTTTVVLPLRESDAEPESKRDWYVKDVTGIGGDNAIISTKQFLGAVEQGSLSFDVRPKNPDLPYSLDGIALHLTSRGDDRVDRLRLAVRSADGRCEVGAGGELPPQDRS
jgi:hypothetical protein